MDGWRTYIIPLTACLHCRAPPFPYFDTAGQRRLRHCPLPDGGDEGGYGKEKEMLLGTSCRR